MVSIRKSHSHQHIELGSPHWLAMLSVEDAHKDALQDCMQWCQSSPLFDEGFLSTGCDMVEILVELRMDLDSLIAGFLYPSIQQSVFEIEDIAERFGDNVVQLLLSSQQMEAMHLIQKNALHRDGGQIDTIRRMLMAIVEDVRAVVIKLSERICYLRNVKNADEETRVLAAKETNTIYAPLANRLGIGQLKWELEDLSFRYLHPQAYKDIAKLLEDKRADREEYMSNFVESVNSKLAEAHIDAEVEGRPKHIYSIWRKMQKKNYDFEHLYDIRAVRVITQKLTDCYAALGIIHTSWYHLHREFSDYVATPKPNGYQSIHTVVVGPEGKAIEIQIRTEKMHSDAELGVAAHWKYKEQGGSAKNSGYDNKINWLRKLLAWQDDLADGVDLGEELRNQVVEDRVYVFTPKGEILDLPVESTPLDFAYYIHSNVGHRCIGAKIGGRIVPFTYQLKTGDQVEILTQKEPNPSRDWQNPSLGFVKSSRARSKIAAWFKLQDKEKNTAAGRDILEPELVRNDFLLKDAEAAVNKFNLRTLDDLLAAVGAGDVRPLQVVNFLQAQRKPDEPPAEIDPRLKQKQSNQQHSGESKNNVVVQGVGNLLTHMAKCCSPVPGDAIHGFITKGKGIAIHRDDCLQLQRLQEDSPERLIEANWTGKTSGSFTLGIQIHALDRTGLLRDITAVLANERVNTLGITSKTDVKTQMASFSLDLEVYNTDTLNVVLSKLNQIRDVIEAKRATS